MSSEHYLNWGTYSDPVEVTKDEQLASEMLASSCVVEYPKMTVGIVKLLWDDVFPCDTYVVSSRMAAWLRKNRPDITIVAALESEAHHGA